MNEMRKLMETVKQINEADEWWKNEDADKKAAEVLKYFGGRYNSIKDGYKAFLDVDGHRAEVESVSIIKRKGERLVVSVSGPGTPSYQVGMSGLAEMEIYKMERVL